MLTFHDLRVGINGAEVVARPGQLTADRVGEQKAKYNSAMPPRKLTPVQVLERLLRRLEKRMEALQRVKLDGFQMVISEMEVEMDYLRRAKRYLEE